MSRVIPADKRKRQLVLVVGPLSLPRSKGQTSSAAASTAVTLPGSASLPSSSSSSSEQSGGLREHQVRAETLTTSLPPSSTAADPHNEVERRRKQRISQNIKTLAETLTPPCNCGRTTRAEILEMVVKQIRDLQQKNSELEAQLKDLPSPATTKGEELSRQAIVLVEENLRLRVLLLAAVGCDNSPNNRHTSSDQSRGEGEEEEEGRSRMAGEEGEGEVDEGEAPLPSEGGDTGREQDEGECVTVSGSSSEEQGGEHDNGETTEKEEGGGGEVEEMERDTGIEESQDSGDGGSESHRTCNAGEGEVGDQDGSGGVGGMQVEGNDKRIEGKGSGGTQNLGRESSGAADQSWPISSLLSHQTRSSGGPLQREHGVAAFGLPILSPTYIAEHCDLQFFGPATTPAAALPPVTSRGTSAADTGQHPTSLFTGGMAALSRVTEFSRPGLAANMSSSSSSVPVPSASSPRSHQQLSLPPPPPPPLPPPRLPSRQSIVQPWVGTCRSEPPSRANRRSSVGSTTATVQTPNGQHQLSVRPQHEPATASSSGFRSSRASSMTRHTTTATRPSRHSSRSSHSLHSRVPRTVSSRGHTHTPHYQDNSRLIHHNLSNVAAEVPAVGGYVSSTNLSCDSRAQPYPGVLPPHRPSTGANFHGYTSVPLPRQPPGFTTSSIDPYYHCTHSTVYQSQQSSSFSLLPPPPCHTSQGSPHSQFTPHHSHFSLPPPPPPHPPPFPHHHQHPPSHQNTVWRPYSDRQQQTSLTRFSLSDILSPSPAAPLGLPATVSPPAIHHQQARIPSFFVDHLLDDL